MSERKKGRKTEEERITLGRKIRLRENRKEGRLYATERERERKRDRTREREREERETKKEKG